ncbi:MAG: hypothetical protein ACRBBN_18515 [Methyloligellaceae bacterium]
MVYSRGKARIKHAETGKIYEINGGQLSFEIVGVDERGMGAETTYSALLDHPDLGQLTWSLWEYPVGAENYRETDVGIHQLLEDIEYGLQHEPPDSEEEYQDRIDTLIQWFYLHYENPVENTPYNGREGGYLWIHGGPFDAREELESSFPEERDDIIDAVVKELEADGVTEWAGVPTQENLDQERTNNNIPEDILHELNSSFEIIPSQGDGAHFMLGKAGLVEMASFSNNSDFNASNPLLEELRLATADLDKSLFGTNTHTDLYKAVKHYSEAVSGKTISVQMIYARGVRLSNSAYSSQKLVESKALPPLRPEIETHLKSVLDLHEAYIMESEDGKSLVRNARDYLSTPQENSQLYELSLRLLGAIEENPKLFSEKVREHTASVIKDIGHGPQPERSNQVAMMSLGNMLSFLATNGMGAIIGGAFTLSAPGVVLASGGANFINLATDFLLSHTSTLQALAGISADLSWFTPLSNVLADIKHRKLI